WTGSGRLRYWDTARPYVRQFFCQLLYGWRFKKIPQRQLGAETRLESRKDLNGQQGVTPHVEEIRRQAARVSAKNFGKHECNGRFRSIARRAVVSVWLAPVRSAPQFYRSQNVRHPA